jgi:hypothetical protein
MYFSKSSNSQFDPYTGWFFDVSITVSITNSISSSIPIQTLAPESIHNISAFLCQEQKGNQENISKKRPVGAKRHFALPRQLIRTIMKLVSSRQGETLFPRCPRNAARKKALGLVIVVIRAVAQLIQAVPFAFSGTRAAENLGH